MHAPFGVNIEKIIGQAGMNFSRTKIEEGQKENVKEMLEKIKNHRR